MTLTNLKIPSFLIRFSINSLLNIIEITLGQQYFGNSDDLFPWINWSLFGYSIIHSFRRGIQQGKYERIILESEPSKGMTNNKYIIHP